MGTTQGTAEDVFSEVLARRSEMFRSEKPLSTTTFVIAMLPRTGSTALASLMAATGVLGDPDEFFNPRGPLTMWLERYPAPDMREYFHTLRRERSSPNGIFSLKTSFQDFAPTLEAGLVSDYLGDTRFVYLARGDLVAQAVSSYIAEESGVWHRTQTGEVYHPSGVPYREPEFDEGRILRKLDDLVAMHQQWGRTFALYSINPLRVTYEDFASDANAVVKRIANFMGVEWEGTVGLESAVTAKLADERSERWAALIRDAHKL